MNENFEFQNIKVAVVMRAFNEEKYIEKSLRSLLNQKLSPYRIIIINDGSTDRTLEILNSFKGIEIINRKRKASAEFFTAEEPKIINDGLEKLANESECKYIMNLDADHVLNPDYLLKIISEMEKEPNLVVCSGVIEGEYFVIPVHSGRVYRYDYLKQFSFKYPEKFAAEDYLILKAQSLGYRIKIFPDIMTKVLRKTKTRYSDPQSYYNIGRGMKALGYAFLYVLIKSSIIGIKNPKNGFSLLKGFLAKNVQLYEPELRSFVRKTQYRNLLHPKTEFYKRGANLIEG
jgi:glycosyltransferase involved in cell wall biosynthesis